jgi:hypothetical protein
VAFIDLRGSVNGDGALSNRELHQIARLDAGLSDYGLRNTKTLFFNRYGHNNRPK